MEQIAVGNGDITIRLSKAELVLVNNALNEVANGVEIAGSEFQTRLGESRSDVRQLLAEVGNAYRALG